VPSGSRVTAAPSLATAFLLDRRRRDVQRLLSRHGFGDLAGRSILELGCGSGGVLLEYVALGAAPRRLHGTDLLPDRLRAARGRLPQAHLTRADGQRLPYKSAAFDVVLQYTVFTSVLDDEVKAGLAREMLRVLRRPGLILWYDFWLNPTNRQTRGIRAAEIRRLFPGCRHDFKRITLAPPLARRLVPVSRLLCSALETLRGMNTHYLVAIRPETGDGSRVP
jgi:ubiquinone/menaquinone biosynthesis C-methylase UbiE